MKRPSVPIPSVAGRMAAELTVIVAGVLIALGAQSWWETRGENEDRLAAVAAIRDDLVTVDANQSTAMARIDTMRVDIHWILNRTFESTNPSDSVFNGSVQNALWEISSTRTQFPAYEELKGSGRLGLLPPAFRSTLLELEAMSVLLERTNEDNFQYQIRNLDPWLLDKVSLRSMLQCDREQGQEAPESIEGISAELLRSRRVENMLLAKLELLTNLHGRSGDGREIVSRLIAAADSLLSESR